MSLEQKKCVFFDRDGVVNEPSDDYFLKSWDEFRFMPGFIESLRVAQEKGYVAVIITNQQGVGKGLTSVEMLDQIHTQLIAELAGLGLELLDVYYCPHLAEEGCACRKPKPGMILDASKKYNLNVGASWMVGDRERDIESGHAAGCRAIRVADDETAAEHRVISMKDLPALLDKIL
jgi:D-glycero-D-manno-heptose 1,7-bisphosphate phosphatase